jgi:hypothetical protein
MAKQDLVHEAWLLAYIKNEAFKNKTYRYYNANVKNMWFKMEDLVLRKLKAISYFGKTKKEAKQPWNGMACSQLLE